MLVILPKSLLNCLPKFKDVCGSGGKVAGKFLARKLDEGTSFHPRIDTYIPIPPELDTGGNPKRFGKC